MQQQGQQTVRQHSLRRERQSFLESTRKPGADMVNDLELPTESTSLEHQLETMKLELLRTQARLHHWQETSVAEAAFLQLRSQYFQAAVRALGDESLYVAWSRSEKWVRMTVCLESSLDCTVLASQPVVADWLKRLDRVCQSEGAIELTRQTS